MFQIILHNNIILSQNKFTFFEFKYKLVLFPSQLYPLLCPRIL